MRRHHRVAVARNIVARLFWLLVQPVDHQSIYPSMTDLTCKLAAQSERYIPMSRVVRG